MTSSTSSAPPDLSLQAPTESTFPNPMDLIIPADSVNQLGALYLGDLGAAVDVPLLRAHSITHIVQVLDVPWLPLEDEGFTYTRVHIDDQPTLGLLGPYLVDACQGINSALGRGENILVHCHQGISRSSSIVIAYLIQSQHLSYNDAFKFVHERRPCVKPNNGFVVALLEWEERTRILDPIGLVITS